jgi:hypothetical protein
MNKFLSLFTIIFVITSCGGGGGGGSSSPSIPSPTISLGGSSLNGNVGDTITINWSSTNTTSCSASGNWSGTKALSGSEDILLLPGDNTFTLQCSGDGGSSTESVVIFAFDLGLYQSQINVDEDQNYTGSIKANPNETLEQGLAYSITEQTANGTLLLLEDANILYTPDSNFFGSDSFVYEAYSPDKNITVSVTINIVVNSINDSPSITPASPETLTKNDLLFDDSYTLRVAVADVDNDLDSLQVDVQIAGGDNIPSTFTPDSEQLLPNLATGDLTLDLTSIVEAGLQEAIVSVYDEEDSSSFRFTSWFIAEKNVVTISQNVDPEDDSVKEDKDYYVYYLSGNSESRGRTKYLFVGDSLAGQNDLSLYRRALLASVNFLNDSDASEFFSEDYFTVVSAEPVEPDGSTPASIRTGCYDFDENIYCIGEMDRSVFDVMLPNNTLVSVLTKVSGRGVNQGSKNIQRIRNDDPERTRTTLMHELGHAHGYMGDEYRSDDDRDVSFYADLNINTSTEPQASNVKWKHHIEDTTNVLGQDVLVCYNYGDGSIADWDDLGITVDQCGCFANQWGELQSDGSYPFLGKNEDCAGVGHFEGNYYGLYDNYRPTFCSIMDSCSTAGYGKVNVEGFAVGSLQNQGFYTWSNASFSTDNTTGSYTALNLSMDVEYDPEKISLRWYENGVEDTSKRDQTSVSFQRPATNSLVFYTARAIDLTGTISAPDSILDFDDFYEGLFQSTFFWCEGYVLNNECSYSYDPNPATYSIFDFGYFDGSIGFTWGQNWTKFQ